ncbi:MAG TPA: SPOR domain-containing protein [Gammaproteobacteria bacterium]|nr:SPOR domain-containing protein [Gammaproteobacteria bacterium]
MAKPKRKSRVGAGGASGFVWMLFGLSIGLVVAAAVYITDRREPVASTSAQAEASSPSQNETVQIIDDTAAAEEPHPATRFNFYDILPRSRFEVVLPEVESQAALDREAVSVGEPGTYVLQAGSFTAPADAERMRANLALLGIESRLQRVSIDDDVYHRVRIGPTDDLDELNSIRRRIRDAQIEVMLIKVPN